MNKAMKWIDEVRGSDSLREVARRTNLNQATLNRQVNLDMLTFETVRDVSRAYGRSVLADLIALEHLTESDAGIEGIGRALAAATDEQLVVEIGKRLDVTPSSLLWDDPVSDAVDRAENVTRMEDHRRTELDDDRAVASEHSDDRGEDGDYDA